MKAASPSSPETEYSPSPDSARNVPALHTGRGNDWADATLRAFFGTNNVSMAVLELHEHDAVYVMVNQRMADFFALPLEIIPGKTAREVGFCEEVASNWLSLLRQVNKTGAAVSLEYPLPFKGRVTWHHGCISPLQTHGQYPQFSFTGLNVTEQRRREQLLSEQNKILELIAAGSSLAECLGSVTSAITRLHPVFRAAVVMLNPPTVVDRVVSDSLPEGLGTRMVGMEIPDFALTGNGRAMQLNRPTEPPLSPAWFEACAAHGIGWAHLSPISVGGASPVAVLLLLSDLPESDIDWVQQLAEFGSHLAAVLIKHDRVNRSLRDSELFYRQTLESIPGMVFTTLPDGFCDYQSQQWVEYTGVAMSEHLGDGWNALLHPDDRPRALAAWRAAVEGKAPYDVAHRTQRRPHVMGDAIGEMFQLLHHFLQLGRALRDG